MDNIEDFILTGDFKDGMAKEHARLGKELQKIRTELAMIGYLDGWTIVALKERRMYLISEMNNCIDFSDRT